MWSMPELRCLHGRGVWTQCNKWMAKRNEVPESSYKAMGIATLNPSYPAAAISNRLRLDKRLMALS